MKKILITGSCGFIGYHLSKKLLESNYCIIGIDSMNDYYDINLKKNRLKKLNQYSNFIFYHEDIYNKENISKIFDNEIPEIVINLAGQAGVRHSIENPDSYITSNIIGFFNILECCRNYGIKHLLYASSSSVYGGNNKIPFSTKDNVDHPVSLYAATKKSNELMAHAYSELYDVPTTGLRFFTVYGPYGRPDMAYFSFTKKIFNDETITIFNNGEMMRDFTYIDDIVESIYRLINIVPQRNKKWNESTDGIDNSFAPYKIYNIGNNQPVKLMSFIEIIENTIGKTAKKEFVKMQMGDVVSTYADVQELQDTIKFKPSTSLEKGIDEFICWYKEYYGEE